MERRKPTILDVAARAGVSKSLVSRVLRQSPLVSAKNRDAVLRAIEELGYRPNAAARTLVQSRSETIGVLITDLGNPFLVEVAQGVQDIAEPAGYTVVVLSAGRQARAEEAALHKLTELRVDGLVCDTVGLPKESLRRAAEGTPVVALTRTPAIPRVDSVVTDDRKGAALVVEHLVGLGHRRIAIIADGLEQASADRLDGYRTSMEDRGLRDEVRVAKGGFNQADGFKAARRLLEADDPPTAIFAGNDFCAFGVLGATAELGLRVPDDVSVVGFDDISFAALQGVGLTTVRQPARDIGHAASEAILSRIDKPSQRARRIVMAPTLMVRSTSGTIR